MHLDYHWLDFVDVHVHGAARDEVTDARGVTRSGDEATVDFETTGGLLTRAVVDPMAFDTDALLGKPLRVGFRRVVRTVYDEPGPTLGLLLDDVPGALIAAGYVHAMQGSTDPKSNAGRALRESGELPESALQADFCSGWRSDGVMMQSIRAGENMPFLPTPPVPDRPEGADGWPGVEVPTPGLRRHRRIDVVPGGGVWRIDAWFRDTYRDPDGAHGALHEYTVDLVVDARDHTILEVRATPHALPWDECPAAADAVTKLVGLPLDGLRSSVPRTLRGIESCTHLTNELRELADVPGMVASL